MRTPNLLHRATALALSWIMPATSVWAAAPPVVVRPAVASAVPVRWSAPLPASAFAAAAAAPAASLAAAPLAALGLTMPPATVTVFGPKKYTRTTGSPNVFTETVTVPSWVVSPYRLVVLNGATSGDDRVTDEPVASPSPTPSPSPSPTSTEYRVTSGSVEINGVEILKPSDFKQTVAGWDKTVALTPTTTLKVTLASKAGSYIQLGLVGAKGDLTTPEIAVAEPAAGAYVPTRRPRLSITYSDVTVSGQPTSGVNPATLKVLVDGTDRTSLFNKTATGATLDWPESLAFSEGPHTVSAEIKDVAGNPASASSGFTVDVSVPVVSLAAPAPGSFHAGSPVTARGSFTDRDPLAGVTCSPGNVAATAAPFVDPAAPREFSCVVALAEGPNAIVARAADRNAQAATASVDVVLDTIRPVVHIRAPVDGSWTSAQAITVSGEVSDVNLRSVTVRGVAAGVSGGTFSAADVPVGSAADETFTVTAVDAAGNQDSHAVTVHVDRDAPVVAITQPAAASFHTVTALEVRGTVSDRQAVSVEVNGVAGTLDGAGGFRATLPVAEGPLDLVATARDAAGTTGQSAAVPVVVDRTVPGIVPSQAPGKNANGWNNSDVTVSFACTDAGSGIASCTPPRTVSVEGGDQQVTGQAVDRAGLEASATHPVSLDKTAPTIATSQQPLPNANGWNSTDVTVSFACNDTLSGVQSCEPAHVVSAEGAGQEVAGTVRDRADNEATAMHRLSIDKGGPTISSSQAPAKNQFGWNNTDVVVSFECADAGSGVESCTAPQTVAAEGQDQTVAGEARDRAGLTTPATHTLSVDKTAPTIAPGQQPLPNANGWNSTDVTVSFACGDTLSGVQSCEPARLVSSEGASQEVTGTVRDRADNEATATHRLSIDKAGPTISSSQAPARNANGWNNTDVVVSFDCADAGSGVESCTAPQTVAAEGQDQTVAGEARDRAGLTTPATHTLSVDKTAPTIAPSQQPLPNANGWNSTDVTVSFACNDALSGVQSCEPAHVVSAEGAGQEVTGTVRDRADNEATATHRLSIDKAGPTISSSQTPAKNANGWNNTDVVVSFECADAGSGVESCTAPQTVAAEGQDQTVAGEARDRAGLTTPATHTLSVDKTAPTIAPSQQPVPNANGWNSTDVTVSFACNDALSGVQSCEPAHVVSAEGAAQEITGTVRDRADNEATATHRLSIDKAGPTISSSQAPARNANGWNNTDVVVSFECADAGSGVESCTAPQTVAAEGQDQAVAGEARDRAGLTTPATHTLSVDKTAPVIRARLSAPANANGWHGADVTVSYECSDALSGIETCPEARLVASQGPDQVFTAEAVDRAGNRATATTTLSIDKSGPAIQSAQAPLPNADGWNRSDVRVSFTCTDDGSGIESCTEPQTVTAEGQDQAVAGEARDRAGLTASTTHTLSVDKTAPTIAASQQPLPNPNGWNSTDVTVSFACADALSGVRSCEPARVVSTEGVGQEIAGTVYDRADNEATATHRLSIDKAGPAIASSQAPAKNANGWNNTDVVVSFECTDAGSGVESCTPSQTITAEGQGQTVAGEAKDRAGLTAAATHTLSVDKTAPIIRTRLSAPANANGWHGADVTISYECSDALSGIETCPEPRLVATQGPDQVFTGEAVDRAGNRATATTTLSIDKSGPAIQSAQSPLPNADGWNRSDVTVTFTCTDDGSGIEACTEPQTVTTEGKEQAVAGEARDRAGLTEATTHTLSVDKTAPTIAASQQPLPNASGWNSTDVTVSFECADTLSGVRTCEPAHVVSAEGAAQEVTGTVRDRADNEATATHRLSIDKAGPTITSSQTPARNANGWNNTDVVVSFECADAGSGVETCTPAQTVTVEGQDQRVAGEARDRAGLTTPATHTLSVDKTSPTIATSQQPLPNANGWNSTDVTVSFTCADGLSGVETCAQAQLVATEGAAQSFTGEVVDRAGNTASATHTLSIDKGAPSITSSQSPAANANGWNRTDVTVTFTCADAGAGVETCTPEQVVSIEGAGLTVEGTATDRAGLNSSTTHTLSVDKTAPTIATSQQPLPNANGWNSTDVTVSFTCADGLSGVETCAQAQLVATEGAAQSFTGEVVDRSGNMASATHTLNIDKAGPTITSSQAPGKNANGWNNTDVVVTFDCTDAGSGVESCTPPQTVTAEGQDRTVAGEARDRAGLTTPATHTLSVDKTAPTIATSQQPLPNANGWNSTDVVVSFECADGLSGVESCGEPVLVSTEGPAQAASGEVRDRAGNTATATLTVKIDKGAPVITIATPLPGALSNAQSITLTGTVADATTVSLRHGNVAIPVLADGSFSYDAPLSAEGENAILLEAEDLAGNRATASRTVVRDTAIPALALAVPAPGTFLKALAGITLTYSDEGTGIDPATLAVTLDGQDRSAWFAAITGGAEAALPEPLADGLHTLIARVSDRAGNVRTLEATFTLDAVAPALSFTTAPPAFTKLNQPQFVLSYADAIGTDPASVRLTLRTDSGAEEDVTTHFTRAATSAAGTLPTLTDGAYELRAEALDRAGNRGEATATFTVDTIAPRYQVTAPTAGAYLPTTTPTLTIEYQDERSGVDLASLVVKVDDADRTSRLAKQADKATGTLQPGDALSQGAHTLTVALADRAGNPAAASPHSFTVDTIPPTVQIELPQAGSFVGSTTVPVRVTYADTGSGLDPPTTKLTADGQPRTGDFALGPDRAEASLTFTDGSHALHAEVKDRAGNPATADASFHVDTTAPVLNPSGAPDYVATLENGTLLITGSVQDLDPGVTITCRVGTTSVQATIEGGQFSCRVPLGEGANDIEITATDSTGHSTTSTPIPVTLDTIPPQVFVDDPSPNSWTNAAAVDVRGRIVDANPRTVTVGGVAAVLDGANFTASAVPVGEGETATLSVLGTDAAGHTGSTSLTLQVDRVAPVITITAPAAGTVLASALVDVTGHVADRSAPMVDVGGLPGEVGAQTAGRWPFTGRFAAVEGNQQITVTAYDAAGNPATASVEVTVDTTPPVIQVTAPTQPFITKAATVHVAGTVDDGTQVTLTIAGQAVPVVNGAFAADIPLPTEGAQTLALVATDRGNHSSTFDLAITVDRTPPTLTVADPHAGDAIGALPLTVLGFASDATDFVVEVDGVAATRTQNAWQAALTLAEGPHTIQVTATDAAGNTTAPVSIPVVVDLTPPAVQITAPASGSITSAGTAVVTGTAQAVSGIRTVTVNGTAATVAGSSFTATVPLNEGNTTLTAVATSATGRQGVASGIVVTRDSTPPVLVLTAPEKISRGRPGQAVASATDNLQLASVVLRLTRAGQPDATLGSFTAPPFSAALTVPENATSGETLTVTAVATDTAGNVTQASRGVRVAADGVITGQALDDVSSRPLSGATVTLLSSATTEPTTTNAAGRYSLPTGDAVAVVRVEKDGYTAVERDITVEQGVGTVPVDARLTKLADAVEPADGALSAGPVALTVPGGSYRLTLLTPQGLPALLPLGWSPLAAFDLRGLSGSASGSLVSSTPGHLVQYDDAAHRWTLLAADLTPADGKVAVTIPGSGAFALVKADAGEPPIAVPPVGQPLEGVAFVAIPATATSPTKVTPPTLPPTGGRAIGSLAVVSPTALPSGTVVSARVTETFNLASGDVASEEERLEDLVTYGSPVITIPIPDGSPAHRLYAEVPIQPSRTFENPTELAAGKVKLEILAGREGVRGKVGGNEAVQVTAGDVTLDVPPSAASQDVAIDLQVMALGTWPSSSSLTPVSEVTVDFDGQTLSMPAQLSVASTAYSDGDQFLLARVERGADGVAKLAVVGLAEYTNGKVRTKAYSGLPGVTESGRLVLYRTAAPVGFVAGTVNSSAGPLKALVTGDGLPFIALSRLNGSYILASATGSGRTITATVPGQPLQATATANVVANETTPLDLLLEGVVTSATVTPANGTENVARTVQIDIATTAAIDPASLPTATVELTKGGTTVPVRLVLSVNGRNLAVIPSSSLDAETTYTFGASGLRDTYGNLIVVPSTTFKTKADTPPVYTPEALLISMPNAQGEVSVTAPAGSFAPGTEILIINAGNGVVVSFTADNDGAVGVIFPATFQASINDSLLITITDPFGNITTFEKTKYVAPDGTTAIGAAGGTVDGPGGIQLRLPAGAVEKGTTFKLEPFALADLPEAERQLPEVGSGASFGSGIKITSEDKPTLKEEAKLAFPLPAGLPTDPKDAFFYVYRAVRGPNGRVLFETLDQAFMEGEGAARKVVTASPPFSGESNSFGAFSASPFGFSATSVNFAYLMWSFNASLPGKPLPGVITGRVLRPKWNPGAPSPEYEGIAGVAVSGVDASGSPLLGTAGNGGMAMTQKDGRFTLWDPQYTGGTVQIAAVLPNGSPTTPCSTPTEFTRCATAVESDAANWASSGLRFYRHVAEANLTFDPVAPPPPPAALEIKVMALVDETGADGQPKKVRKPTQGVVTQGQELVIGFRSTDAVTVAEVGSQTFNVVPDPLKALKDPMAVDFIVDPNYTAATLGTQTVKATAPKPLGGPATTASQTFLVVAPGGSNNASLPGEPPKVIESRTLPKDKAADVEVTFVPQVVFNEPVKNLPGHVFLEGIGGADEGQVLPIGLVGIGTDANGQTVVFDDFMSASQTVTSVSLRPRSGLKFGSTYQIRLDEEIVDTDVDGATGQPAPKHLAEYKSTFTTTSPSNLTPPGQSGYASPAVVVLDKRAYLIENLFQYGTWHAFNVSNPVVPQEIQPGPGSETGVVPRPIDFAGVEDGGAKTLVVAVGPTNQSKPSSLLVYDASDDGQLAQFKQIGAASLTSSSIDGFINRVVMHNGFAFAATVKKGIQTVDLSRAKANYEEALADPIKALQMRQGLNTSGQGFGQDAVTQTISLKLNPADGNYVNALAAGDVPVDGLTRTVVVATGENALAVVDPHTAEKLYLGGVTTTVGPLLRGTAIALTRQEVIVLGERQMHDLALVAGVNSANQPALAVVDLVDPHNPQGLALIQLLGSAQDIVVQGTTALVGESGGKLELVTLEDPKNPRSIGVIENMGGRLALGPDGIVFSTAWSRFGAADPLTGLQTASFGSGGDLLGLLTPRVNLPQVADLETSDNKASTAEPPTTIVPVSFTLTRKALVTITSGGSPIMATVDEGTAPVSVNGLLLSAGLHHAYVKSNVVGKEVGAKADFVVSTQDLSEVPKEQAAQGKFRAHTVNARVTPEGTRLVQGVDLFDGHLVYRAVDFTLPGRHLGLQLVRTYSSSGRIPHAPMGANWSHNYESHVERYDNSDGTYLFLLRTADGTTQAFNSTDGKTFTAPEGYHTTLAAESDEASPKKLVFTDLAGNRHHFERIPYEDNPRRWRLVSIQEPHGDEIKLDYVAGGLLWEVKEVQAGVAKRALRFKYEMKAEAPRLKSVEDLNGLKLKVDYSYDNAGNLVQAVRYGQNLDTKPIAPARTESYAYSTSLGGPNPDLHQLVKVTDPNLAVTEYVYDNANAASFPLKGDAGIKSVTRYPGTAALSTKFSYGFSTHTVTVMDPRNNVTTYTLDGHGLFTQVDEPLGRTTKMTWEDRRVKTLTDPNSRAWTRTYDAKGWPAAETISTTEFGSVSESWQYDPVFGKPKKHVDRAQRTTAWELNDKGDVTQQTDAAGNVTKYAYEAPGGLLSKVTDPRGKVTQVEAYNSFGQPLEIKHPLPGVTTTLSYDARGRLESQTDKLGHRTDQVWDGLDRLTKSTRYSLSASPNEVTQWAYYSGGQVKTETNPLGAVTTYTLDGANRLTDALTTLAPYAPISQKWEYDGNDNRVFERDARGVETRLVYDARNWLMSVAIESGPAPSPIGLVESYDYDQMANRTLEKNELTGAVTTMQYDELDRVRKKLLPENGENGQPYAETYTYDLADNLETVLDATGQKTSYKYDGLNRVIETKDALGHVATVSYAGPEGSHLLKAFEDDTARKLKVSFGYDDLGRETQRVTSLYHPAAPATYTTTTTYDDAEHQVTVSAPGLVTESLLDGLDRVTQSVVAPGSLALTTKYAYDAAGNVTQMTDPRGMTWGSAYDKLGRLRETIDPSLKKAQQTPDGAGLVQHAVDRRGVAALMTYDNLGRPLETSVSGPFTALTWARSNTYLDATRKRVETDSLTRPTTYRVDGMGRLTSVTDAANNTATFTWNGVDRISVKDRRNNVTQFAYDPLHRLQKTTDPAPFQDQTYTTDHLDTQNRVEETDRRGTKTVTQLDSLGRVVSVTRDGIKRESRTYDANGRLFTVTDGEDHVRKLEYDQAGRLVKLTEGTAVTTFVLDQNGNVLEEKDGRANAEGLPAIVRTYDSLNRLLTEKDAAGNTTSFTYDGEGNATSVTNPKGRVTAYAYGELGELIRVTQPAVAGPDGAAQQPVTQYVYDPERNLIDQVDAKSQVVRREYDPLNRVKKLIQDPAGLNLTTGYDYDPEGNLVTLTEPNGSVRTNVIDALNRVKQTTFALGAGAPSLWRQTIGLAYTYDKNGNLTHVADTVAGAGGGTLGTVRAFDKLDRLTSEETTLPNGGTRTVQYAYWNDDNRRTLTDPESGQTSYAFDGQDRLSALTSPAGAYSFEYHPDGLLKQALAPNGVKTIHTYDAADRLLTIEHKKGDEKLAGYAYTYDPNGNRITQTEILAGMTGQTSYGYDTLDRLASVTYPGGMAVAYGFDLVGNRNAETTTGPGLPQPIVATAQFDAVNRLTHWAGQGPAAEDFVYDASGNPIQHTVSKAGCPPFVDPCEVPVTVTASAQLHDARGLLTEVVTGGSGFRFQYDPFGRRTLKVGELGTEQFVYDGDDVFVRYLQDTATSPELRTRYERAGGSRLLGFGDAIEGQRFYGLDALGSPTLLSDEAGGEAGVLRLDAWGVADPGSTMLANSKSRFGFTGYWMDEETASAWAKSRSYLPAFGRFATQDSFLGRIEQPESLSRYAYAFENPTRYVDRDGHDPDARFVFVGMDPKQRKAAIEEQGKQGANAVGGALGLGRLAGKGVAGLGASCTPA